MERRPISGFWALVGALAMFAGCGQPSDSGAKVDAKVPAIVTVPAGATTAGADSPAHTVRMFLEAVRKSDDDAAARWLTALARQKTRELQMAIAPPGTETAQFEVGEVEMVEGGAHVASIWSDVDSDGDRQKESIVWVVAKEPEGWRICGMATTLFEEKLPIVLNFEEPEEMARKQQFFEAEAARRAAQASALAEPAAKKTEDSPPADAPQDRMTDAPGSESPAPLTASRNVLRAKKPH